MVRPTQQTSTKRKRKSNDLIWARDGDHKNAQEHPAYLLENCNEEDGVSTSNNDKVWVEWSSNGTVACIPKSRISTAGLSTRRRRHKSNVRKQPVDNNDNEPISNDNFDGDNLSSVGKSKAIKERSVQVKEEDTKVKEEIYGGETDDEEGDRKIAAVPTPVVSLHPKEEDYEEDTDDDIALDQVQSTHVTKVKEELEESTDEEGIAPDLVQSTHIKTEEAGEDTDDEGITSDVKEGELTLSQIRLNQRRIKLKQKKKGKLQQNNIIQKSAQSNREKEEDEDDDDEEEGGDVDADNTDGDIKTLQYVVPDQILVEGCSKSNVDGVYTQVARLSKANFPVYSKRGEWKGKAVVFVICRKKNDCGWLICRWKGNVTQSGTYAKKKLYTSKDKVDPNRKYHRRYRRYTNVPPPTGWRAKRSAKYSRAPTLKYDYNTTEASEAWETSPLVSAKFRQKWGYDSDIDMVDRGESDISSFDEVDNVDPWDYESDNDTYSIATWDSSNEQFNKSADVYLWCENGSDLLLLPYNWYLFWRMLDQCQTWGEIRRLCGKNKRCYEWLLERYETKYDRFKYKMDKEFNVDMLTDNKAVCMDDFNLGDHIHYDLPGSGVFPPLIEQVMEEASYFDETRCGWMLDWADLTFSREYDSLGLRFDLKDKDAIFKKVEDLGRTIRLRYSSKLSWFESRFDYGWKT